ncbi:MAG: ankyrin repeat domain-containing protein [bacterium]
MGTLENTIQSIEKYTLKENLLTHAEEAIEEGHLQDGFNLLVEFIEKNKHALKTKPQNKSIRNNLTVAYKKISELQPYPSDYNLPKQNSAYSRSQESIKESLLSLFTEKNWQKQCNGKFGGPKPTTMNWKTFYQYNEQTFQKLSSKEKKLSWAASNGHIKIIKTLIVKHKALLRKKNNPYLEDAIKNGFNDIAKLLIENGHSIDTQNKDKWTLLHWSCYNNDIELSRYLINQNIKINTKDKNGLMPIHLASLNGNTDLVRLLKKHNCHLNAKDQLFKLTPIQMAAFQDHHSCIELLIELGANYKVQDPFGRTLLHWAAITQNTKLTEKLLNLKVNCNQKDKLKRSALHWAAQQNAYEIISLLIKENCQINDIDYFNETPLLIAAFYSNKKAYSILLESTSR